MGELRAVWDSIEMLSSINSVSQVILTVLVLLTFLVAAVVNATSWRRQGLQRIEDLKQAQALADANAHSSEANRQAGLANERASDADVRAARLELEAERLRVQAEEAKLARAQIEARLAPRRLTAERSESVVAQLSPYAEQRLNVFVVTGDTETLDIAHDVLKALSTAGWAVTVESGQDASIVEPGMLVGVEAAGTQQDVAAATALVEALRSQELAVLGPRPQRPPEVTTGNVSRDPNARIRLVINRKL